MQVVVKRDKWIHGTGGSNSFLLDENGCACILGCYLLACGYEENHLRRRRTPACVAMAYGLKLPEWLLVSISSDRIDDSIESQAIYRVNDRATAINYKEAKLKNLFAKQGIILQFE